MIRNGTIHIGEVPVSELASTYGTPTYVYDEEKIRGNYRRVMDTFKRYYEDFHLCYAIKGNDNPAVAHILRQEGAGIALTDLERELDGTRARGSVRLDPGGAAGFARAAARSLVRAAIRSALAAFRLVALPTTGVQSCRRRPQPGHPR